MHNKGMKVITLIRHAKSSWKFPELDDHDRPLNKRGKRDRFKMADYLAQQAWTIEMVYSSTAKRALDYAQTLSQVASLPLAAKSDLYTFSAERLLSFIESIDESLKDVALVGHNPAITSLTNILTNQVSEQLIDNVPTAAMARIELPISSWRKISDGGGKLGVFQIPKALVI